MKWLKVEEQAVQLSGRKDIAERVESVIAANPFSGGSPKDWGVFYFDVFEREFPDASIIEVSVDQLGVNVTIKEK